MIRYFEAVVQGTWDVGGMAEGVFRMNPSNGIFPRKSQVVHRSYQA